MADDEDTADTLQAHLTAVSAVDVKKVAGDFGLDPIRLSMEHFAYIRDMARNARPSPGEMKAELQAAKAMLFSMSLGSKQLLREALDGELSVLDEERLECERQVRDALFVETREHFACRKHLQDDEGERFPCRYAFDIKYPENYKLVRGLEALEALASAFEQAMDEVTKQRFGPKGYLHREALPLARHFMGKRSRPYPKGGGWRHLETAQHVRDGLAAMQIVKATFSEEAVAARLAGASSAKSSRKQPD